MGLRGSGLRFSRLRETSIFILHPFFTLSLSLYLFPIFIALPRGAEKIESHRDICRKRGRRECVRGRFESLATVLLSRQRIE